MISIVAIDLAGGLPWCGGKVQTSLTHSCLDKNLKGSDCIAANSNCVSVLGHVLKKLWQIVFPEGPEYYRRISKRIFSVISQTFLYNPVIQYRPFMYQLILAKL